MIVWGGSENSDGAVFDLASTSWQSISNINSPTGRSYASAVWTGQKMVVFGGEDADGNPLEAIGGVYNPTTDTWTSIQGENSASPTYGLIFGAFAFINSQMLLWGGYNQGGYVDVGYFYNGTF